MSNSQPLIIVGGGLAGISCAHRALELGATRIVLLEKEAKLGGNALKASSGINGAPTSTQKASGVDDSVELFGNDTTASAGNLARPELINALTSRSADAVDWLSNNFKVDLSIVSQLGGHSAARTHRGIGGAPGWAITSALIKQLEAEEKAGRITVERGAKVVSVLGKEGAVEGVTYDQQGTRKELQGQVVVASGGYSLSHELLFKHRPDLLSVPTTSGPHATGDLHILLQASNVHASLVDLREVQVHPTGFVDPSNPTSSTKFLAAEALRGAGGILVNAEGQRFVNELDRRDAVSASIQTVLAAGSGPVRLLMTESAVDSIKEHCKFYVAKGLMKRFDNLAQLATDSGMSTVVLRSSFDAYRVASEGGTADAFGKTIFPHADFVEDAPIYAAIITPVVHYTMGGIEIVATGRVLDTSGNVIQGLYAAGEATGGIHGHNRLAGSSLLECVVFGRLAAETALAHV
ncbi:Flavocytochrome c [Exidia glandulosa HHB12029]|uniref:Fumarate reductase n=1 Tax=Exidia glandulosa HHB12029 TaxID=1314781 RepID=A0A166BQB8_EXIGL|nr:Flavocytochrome c [Exidia glandulosa HHB12029]